MFELYGRNDCIWCDRAKSLLEEKGLPYAYRGIDLEQAYVDNFKVLFPGATTVPQIIYNVPTEDSEGYTIWIGGYSDLVTWLENADESPLR